MPDEPARLTRIDNETVQACGTRCCRATICVAAIQSTGNANTLIERSIPQRT
jgi:hypothetical protein